MSQELQTEVNNEDNLQSFYNKVYIQGDSISQFFILGFFTIGILLAFVYNSFLLAFFMGGFSVLAFFAIQIFFPHSQFLRYLTSFLFWNFGVQYLLQMQGLYEMHFFFFIGLTVLLFYEDWKVLMPATLYALITIIILYSCRDLSFFKNHLPKGADTTPTSFMLHFLLVLLYGALCAWWSIMQRSQTKQSALQSITLEKQLLQMEANIIFADNISQGNLQVDYSASEADKLGQSLLNMRKSLTELAQREEKEKFSTTGLARIGEILRQHAQSLELLCDRVLDEIVKYMKANQGEIFMVEEKGTGKEHLKLVACRAWDRKKYLQKTVDFGEGLVGQSAIEKRAIFITEVPDSYITLSSGLGKSNPKSVLIIPLKADDEIVGVIEIASFKVFAHHEIMFLERVGESIASTMLTTQSNQRNKMLLEKSNALAEQMRAQEEAIRQNLEEMQATQEEMVRKEAEINRLLAESLENEVRLKEKIEEIKTLEKNNKIETDRMLDELEYNRKIMSQVIEELPEKIFLKDENGRLLLLNSALAVGYNKSIEELLGKNDFDLFPKEDATGYWAIENEIIKSGKPLTIYEDFQDGYGELRTMYSNKMPFRFPNTSKIGILGYQVDVTDIKRMESKVKDAENAIQELNNLREEVERLRSRLT